jgi:WhiB family redox-sensing transcriptional regulator
VNAMIQMGSIEWMTDALCPQVSQDLFFPEKGKRVDDAKSVCRDCPVTDKCLQLALSIPGGVYGIWGGTTEAERRRLRRRAV